MLSLVGLTVGFLEQSKNYQSNLVSQVHISVYLLVQCELQLRHTVTTLSAVLRLVLITYRRLSVELIIDRLLLSFKYRKARRTPCYHQTHRNR